MDKLAIPTIEQLRTDQPQAPDEIHQAALSLAEKGLLEFEMRDGKMTGRIRLLDRGKQVAKILERREQRKLKFQKWRQWITRNVLKHG